MMVPWTKMEAAEMDTSECTGDSIWQGSVVDEGERGVRDDAVVLTHPLSVMDGGDRKRVGEG